MRETDEARRQRLAAIVEGPHRSQEPAPWEPFIRGTVNTCFLDDLSVLALAEGIVLARVQAQARLLARTIDREEPT